MAIEAFPIQRLWGILRRLPGFILRWYFTPEKLAKLIYIDVRPRHDSAMVDLGEAASFSLYLQVINLSPLAVELDRAKFRLWCGGTTINGSILEKQVIAPGEIATLYVHEAIPDGYANQMARQHKNNSVSLDGNIEFVCKVRAFAKTVGQLDGINAKIYNERFRAAE